MEQARHSRNQRESYSRRRPMPLRIREGRQETEGRKRPMKQAGFWLRDESEHGEDDEQVSQCFLERRR